MAGRRRFVLLRGKSADMSSGRLALDGQEKPRDGFGDKCVGRSVQEHILCATSGYGIDRCGWGRLYCGDQNYDCISRRVPRHYSRSPAMAQVRSAYMV